MKILVIGADGQVGGFLLKEAAGRHQAFGTSLLGLPGLPALDITKEAEVRDYFRDLRPDYTILTAALTHVDLCEQKPEQAEAINYHGPVHVARACRETGSGLAFFSTDYVFDGIAGPYGEEDAPNPESVYARTKLNAENEIREMLENHLIVRTMMVFSYLPGSVNFFMQVLDRFRKGEPIAAPNDQLGNPTHAVNLAAGVLELVESQARGVFHVAGTTWLGKADFARRIVEKLGGDPGSVRSLVTADMKQPAKRPLQSGLKVDKAGRMLRRNPLWSLDEALDYSLAQMKEPTIPA